MGVLKPGVGTGGGLEGTSGEGGVEEHMQYFQ